MATEDKTCSDLGVHILHDLNGTAVDAAITSVLCIGLLNAFSSGIGGGGFMTVRIPDGSASGGSDITSIDFRETSPEKSEKEMYGSNRAGRVAAQVGGLAVGVPGELRGLEMGEWYRLTRLTGSAQNAWDSSMEGSGHAGRCACPRMAYQPGAG